MSETEKWLDYTPSTLVVGPYGQPVVRRGYMTVGGVRIYDDVLVVGPHGEPQVSRGGIAFPGGNDTSGTPKATP